MTRQMMLATPIPHTDFRFSFIVGEPCLIKKKLKTPIKNNEITISNLGIISVGKISEFKHNVPTPHNIAIVYAI